MAAAFIQMPVLVMIVLVIMMFGIFVAVGLGGLSMIVFGELMDGMLIKIFRLARRRRLKARVLDDLALDALAIAATTRGAVARTPPVGTIFGFFLGLAVGALVGFDQRLTVGNRNLIIVRMNFAEGQKAVAVAAILDKGRLQRRLYARDLGEIDVAA